MHNSESLIGLAIVVIIYIGWENVCIYGWDILKTIYN